MVLAAGEDQGGGGWSPSEARHGPQGTALAVLDIEAPVGLLVFYDCLFGLRLGCAKQWANPGTWATPRLAT